MVLCLGEPLGGFCDVSCCCCFSFIFVLHSVVVLHLLLFFIHFPGYFIMPPALHPGFSGPWRPPPALSSTLTNFDCLCFFIYRERYGFEWAFFTHRRFLPYAPSPRFWLNLLLSRPPWEPAVFPWSLQGFTLILKTQTWPIRLFHSQQSIILTVKRLHI